MRIIQVIQKRQLRGAEIFASQLSQRLVALGHEVILVSLFPGHAELPFTGRQYLIQASPKGRLLDVGAWKRLSELIREFKPDIVQANAGDTLKYVVFSRLIFRWRSKIVFRNANVMSAFIRGKIHHAFNTWLLRHCDYFISVSENCRQDLISLHPAARRNSRTIPIGTNVDEFVPGIQSRLKEHPVFLAVGSLVPEKNHTFLLDVFHHYLTAHGKAELWIVGDGRLRSPLEEKATRLGMFSSVKFWGYRRDIIGLLQQADVFVMPSLIEGLPAVILEAIACEVPVVASAVGGIPEVIEHEVTGICLHHYDAKEYAQFLARILEEAAFRNGLVRRAKELLVDKLTLEKVTADFDSLYRKIMTPATA